jgi:hypothetical protein
MPPTTEYRLFFLDGGPILYNEYWEEGEYEGNGPPVGRFTALASRVRSRSVAVHAIRDRVRTAGGVRSCIGLSSVPSSSNFGVRKGELEPWRERWRWGGC